VASRVETKGGIASPEGVDNFAVKSVFSTAGFYPHLLQLYPQAKPHSLWISRFRGFPPAEKRKTRRFRENRQVLRALKFYPQTKQQVWIRKNEGKISGF